MKPDSQWPIHEDGFNVVVDAAIALLLLFFLFVPNLATGM